MQALPNKISLIGNSDKILRFEFACAKPEVASLLPWLKTQNIDQKVYWEDRSDAWEMAGVGEAHVITGKEKPDYQNLLATLRARLSEDNPQLRYYGGFRFSESLSKDDTWTNFNAYRFIIPRFELLRLNQSYTFAYNIMLNEIKPGNMTDLLAQFNQLIFDSILASEDLPNFYDRQDSPNEQEWQNSFNKTIARLDSPEYEKIVLARKSILKFSEPLDPFQLLIQLKDNTPHCFHFCFSPKNGKAFLGASPERLYKRAQGHIETEAIAGTRPRGSTPEEDHQLKEDLLKSAKDAHEHQCVVDFIKKSLNPKCHNLEYTKQPNALTLNVGHHLITRFEGALHDDVYDHEILSQMHPTPAVAGTPQDSALTYINQNEPFDRGLYAAPIGYIAYGTTEFIVAIRSGLIQDHQLSLFAGAGIVKESQCDDEWNEIENKIGNFLKIFNHVSIPIS